MLVSFIRDTVGKEPCAAFAVRSAALAPCCEPGLPAVTGEPPAGGVPLGSNSPRLSFRSLHQLVQPGSCSTGVPMSSKNKDSKVDTCDPGHTGQPLLQGRKGIVTKPLLPVGRCFCLETVTGSLPGKSHPTPAGGEKKSAFLGSVVCKGGCCRSTRIHVWVPRTHVNAPLWNPSTEQRAGEVPGAR